MSSPHWAGAGGGLISRELELPGSSFWDGVLVTLTWLSGLRESVKPPRWAWMAGQLQLQGRCSGAVRKKVSESLGLSVGPFKE